MKMCPERTFLQRWVSYKRKYLQLCLSALLIERLEMATLFSFRTGYSENFISFTFIEIFF